jgi:hypothetical protein
MGERNINLALQSTSVHICTLFFTCCKILWHGASGFTSPLKEGMLQIFITLKNPSPQLGLNMWTLGPMAGTLTITPLRWPAITLSRINGTYMMQIL